MEKPSEKCAAEQEKMRNVLQDIKILTRDVTDIKKNRELKQQITGFENEIDQFCSEKDGPNST